MWLKSLLNTNSPFTEALEVSVLCTSEKYTAKSSVHCFGLAYQPINWVKEKILNDTQCHKFLNLIHICYDRTTSQNPGQLSKNSCHFIIICSPSRRKFGSEPILSQAWSSPLLFSFSKRMIGTNQIQAFQNIHAYCCLKQRMYISTLLQYFVYPWHILNYY